MISFKKIYIEAKSNYRRVIRNKICGDCFLPLNACNCDNNIDHQKRTLIDKEIIENRLKNKFNIR